MRKTSFLAIVLSCFSIGSAADYNEVILESLRSMPRGGVYAAYRKNLPEERRFDDLHKTVEGLDQAIAVDGKGRLSVKAKKAAAYSFCSSATYLLFCKAVESLQQKGVIASDSELNREMADVGNKLDVIGGNLDGIGIFGHWNADGPGTAVLFQRLKLGRNFSDFNEARPGDFLKIFWNDSIGKGERGHLVLYLGASEDGSAIEVWSSNMVNADGSAGYGRMWVEKSRISRALFSRLENPENLVLWKGFSRDQKASEYLIRIRKTGSSSEEMERVTGAVN